jgi:hypothetical protein
MLAKLVGALVTSLALLPPGAALSQQYPVKPLR